MGDFDISLFFLLFRKNSEGKAETKVVEAERRRVAVTMRRAAAPRTVEPAATTAHAERPTVRSCRIRLRATAIVAIPVRAPLPYVAAHIVNAEFIG